MKLLHVPHSNKAKGILLHSQFNTHICHLSSLTAEVYTSMSKPAEAAACTQEAANLFPTSHNVLYMRGQIAELRGNMDEAKRWYEEALSINPTHVKTMQRLVILLLLCPCVWPLESITNLVLCSVCTAGGFVFFM